MLSVQLKHALKGFALNISFEAPQGITVLFGRSGTGKTTVINAVAGLLKPDQGRVQMNDRTLFDTDLGLWVPSHRRRVGYIFQEGRLFPHLTVRQNLLYGRWFSGVRADPLEFDQIIDMLGISHLLDRRPVGLSGGEQQRVSIGRALLAKPELILADEPLAALDEARKSEILPYFERLRDEVKIPVLYVSHSATEVARLATTVVVLQDGAILRQGPATEVLSDPAVVPTGVRSAGALLQARVHKHHADGLTELDVGGTPMFLPKVDHAPGQQVRLRIAAHDVILSREAPQGLSALNIIAGTITQVHTGSGPGAIVALETSAGTLLARITQRSVGALDLQAGVTCHAVIKSVAISPGNIGG